MSIDINLAMRDTSKSLDALIEYIKIDFYNELIRISKLKDIEDMRKQVRNIAQGIIR